MVVFIAYTIIFLAALLIVILLLPRRSKMTLSTIVSEMKKIDEYCPMIFYDEIVVPAKLYKEELKEGKIKIGDIAILAHKAVPAIINLSHIEVQDIQKNHRTISIIIPHSKLPEEISINPTDYTILPKDTNEQSLEGLMFLLRKGAETIRIDAQNSDFLKKADNAAKTHLEYFFSRLGYKTEIKYREDTTALPSLKESSNDIYQLDYNSKKGTIPDFIQHKMMSSKTSNPKSVSE